jgi:tRNA(fMet)-specific endonuclease VapC
MSQTLIADTVAAIGFLNNDKTLLASLQADDTIVIPIVVLGELFGGAEKSSRAEENRKRIDIFSAKRRVLIPDIQTAKIYGRLISELRKKGRPIPQNDAWIASFALQFQMPVLTRDAHFENADGLQIRRW